MVGLFRAYRGTSMANMTIAMHKGIQDTSKLCSCTLIPEDTNDFYSGSPSPQPGYNDAYAQNQAYQQSLQSGQSPYDAGAQEQQFSPQSSDPNAPNYDPKAPPMSEGERGLLGSLGGGVAGHMLGKKAGHGFLGTVGGGILGSLAEDFLKDSKKKKHHHAGSHHHHSSQGGSSWGGRH